MRLKTLIMTTMTLLAGLTSGACEADSVLSVDGFPMGEDGIEKGVSACYAGRIGDCIVMAGGCNFPVNTLAPDSKKKYYKGIYAARIGQADRLRWTRIGELPDASAYGVAVSCDNSMIIAGGMNGKGSQRAVYRITLVNGRSQVASLPALPCTADNMAGAVVGRRLYVAGGMMDGRPSCRVLCLDLDRPDAGWKERKPFPGIMRIQPVAGSMGDRRFCIFGGFAPAAAGAEARLALAGCVYDETTEEWQPLEGPKDAYDEPLFVGGGAAVQLSKDSFLVAGGVNKDVFLSAVNHPQAGYLNHPEAWYRFNPYTLLYNKEGWSIIGKSRETARAGAALVPTRHGIYVIGGELKPRVRSNRIVRIPPLCCQSR